MRNSIISYLVLIMILMAAGCATSNSAHESDAMEHKPGFDTGLQTADFGFKSSSLFDPVNFKYQISSQCTGTKCTSDEVWLEYFIMQGPTVVILYDLSLTLNMGDVKYQWLGPDLRDEGGTSAVGLVKSVQLDDYLLYQLALNEDISGYFAGEKFEWSYENREPFRNLLADLQTSNTEN